MECVVERIRIWVGYGEGVRTVILRVEVVVEVLNW